MELAIIYPTEPRLQGITCVGHGAHTASTASGNLVRNASFYGLARGTARGGVPRARIAVCSVCYEISCPDHAILAAFDDAIADDGVDIITASLALETPVDVTLDSFSIGGFHSVEEGILTAQSGGNDGPGAGTVTSLGPWLFTVAASTTDRQIIDKLALGNRKALLGSSINSFSANGTMFPLIDGPDATTTYRTPCAGQNCAGACFNKSLVKGKIVMCTAYLGNSEVQQVGALGSILPGPWDDGSPLLPLPALVLGSENCDSVISYINSTMDLLLWPPFCIILPFFFFLSFCSSNDSTVILYREPVASISKSQNYCGLYCTYSCFILITWAEKCCTGSYM